MDWRFIDEPLSGAFARAPKGLCNKRTKLTSAYPSPCYVYCFQIGLQTARRPIGPFMVRELAGCGPSHTAERAAHDLQGSTWSAAPLSMRCRASIRSPAHGSTRPDGRSTSAASTASTCRPSRFAGSTAPTGRRPPKLFVGAASRRGAALLFSRHRSGVLRDPRARPGCRHRVLRRGASAGRHASRHAAWRAHRRLERARHPPMGTPDAELCSSA